MVTDHFVLNKTSRDVTNGSGPNLVLRHNIHLMSNRCIYRWYEYRRVQPNEYLSLIGRLNSGIKNRNNFFAWAIFLIQKVGTNSVIYADSGDINILAQFPRNSILKIFQNFWKCVGGIYMRGCLILKIAQSVQLFILINFIYKIRGIHLISCQPTQFQPP